MPQSKDRVAEWVKKTRLIYTWPTRDSLQSERHREIESEGMERYSMQIETKRKLR